MSTSTQLPNVTQNAAIIQAGGTGAEENHHLIDHYVKRWAYSRNTIIREFAKEEVGVMKLTNYIGKRKYTTLSISESAAARVYQRLCHDFSQPKAAGRNPLRVVSLRGLDAGVTK